MKNTTQQSEKDGKPSKLKETFTIDDSGNYTRHKCVRVICVLSTLFWFDKLFECFDNTEVGY